MNKSLACHLMPVWLSALTKRNRRNNLNCLVKPCCAAMVAILLTALPSVAAENVKAWGSSEYGQLGNGISGFNNPGFQGPEAVIELGSVKAVAAGAGFSLALKSDGTVWAWGTNSCGELGNGSNHSSTVRVPVNNLTGVVAIAAWGSVNFIDYLSSVWAWGWNGFGQLGTGNRIRKNVPVPVTAYRE